MAPTDPLPIVRNAARDHHGGLDIMRWGLVPFWAKEVKIGDSTFNATRGEEVDTKPAFRDAERRRRCLMPLSNFAPTSVGRPKVSLCLNRDSSCRHTGCP